MQHSPVNLRKRDHTKYVAKQKNSKMILTVSIFDQNGPNRARKREEYGERWEQVEVSTFSGTIPAPETAISGWRRRAIPPTQGLAVGAVRPFYRGARVGPGRGRGGVDGSGHPARVCAYWLGGRPPGASGSPAHPGPGWSGMGRVPPLPLDASRSMSQGGVFEAWGHRGAFVIWACPYVVMMLWKLNCGDSPPLR